jgi:hypothetical protein
MSPSPRPNEEQIRSGAEVDKSRSRFPFVQYGSDDDFRGDIFYVRHRCNGDSLHLLSYLVRRLGEDVTQCHWEQSGGHELEAYAFGKIATIALIGAITAFVLAALMAILLVFGIVHARRVSESV